MIPVTLTALTWIYLVLFMALIGLCWFASVWRARRSCSKLFSSATQCRLCGCEFWIDPGEGPVRCPACGAANERIPLRRP